MQPDCVESVAVAPEPEPVVVHEYRPALIAVVLIVAVIVIFDWWALSTGHRTISQMFQDLPRWERIALSVIWGIAGWHLFWKGPL